MATYELSKRQYESFVTALKSHMVDKEGRDCAEIGRGPIGEPPRMGTIESEGTVLAFFERKTFNIIEIRTTNPVVKQFAEKEGVRPLPEKHEVYNLSPAAYKEFRGYAPARYNFPSPDKYEELTGIFTRGGKLSMSYDKEKDEEGKEKVVFRGATIDTTDYQIKKILQDMIKMDKERGVAKSGVETALPIVKLVPEEKEKKKITR